MQRSWAALHRYFDKFSVRSNGNHRLERYGFVILISILFYVIKSALSNALGVDVPFLFALFIVMLSAWIGGLGPGILATLLSGSITYFFFLEPKLTLLGKENIPNIFVMLVFLAEGIFVSIISEAHRRSDTQKSEFIGVISHELKNPLASMKGYAEISRRMAEKKGEKKLADIAMRIDLQIKHVTQMINEMLDITKIETGRLTYQEESFDITNLVKELIGDQQVTTSTHKIQFTGKAGKQITGDRYRIGQVITNLISNAIKYAPNTKKINVSVTNKKNAVLISVKDFGPGIEKKEQAKLFEAFYRAKKTQSAKGTGIGLFIASQIVKHHNGKLWVESTPGKGSTFFLQLPVQPKKV